MTRLRLAISSALLLSSGAACSGGGGDGGNLKWQKDPKKGYELAHSTGKPMLVYFTSDGWGACAELSAGAFSDDEVLAATKGVVCVFVDLEWGQQHTEYAQRYGVRALPTVVYTDSDGEEVSRMSSPDPAAMVGELQQLTRDHTRSFGSVESSMPAPGSPGSKGRPRAR